MQDFMRRMGLISGLGLAVVFGACGDDDDKPKDTTTATDTTPDTTDTTATETQEEVTENDVPETVETTYATLTFSIDDSANKTFDATDKLVWKGSFTWDDDTNVITFDSSWGGGAGPYPLLYDDGPAPGGNEKPGAVAGDNIWTTVVKIATPTEALTLEYGAAYDETSNSWIWPGPGNGTVVVPAGSTAQIDATGMTVAPHGTIDMILTIDVSGDGANLAAIFQGQEYTDVKVKGSAWGWGNEVPLTDDGTKGDETADDDIYTFVLSENLSKHAGLLRPGDQPQFVFLLGGVEYKADGAPSTAGVAAWVSDGTTTLEADVTNLPDGDKNTIITAPSKVQVTFSIDDSANKTYDAADGLAWKGSFSYDDETNTITKDGAWGGPFVNLYDDGPPPTGSEAPGATAGDNIWTAQVWVSNSADNFEYGAIRGSTAGSDGAWIWNGAGNGTFAVAAGTLTPIVATGMVIPAFGTIDLRLVIDTSNDGANLNALFQGETYAAVKVKGSAWGWSEITLLDDGLKGDTTAADGKYTFVLSENIGEHDGLLKLGGQPEFIFVLDASEYKNADGEGAQEGVTAWSDYGGAGADACVTVTASCVAETLEVNSSNKNTMVTIGADAQ